MTSGNGSAAGDLTAIVNARLWDGTRSAPEEGAAVIIEGDRIREAGASVAVPEEATRIDAGGRFVMPGLVEMHTHVGLAGGEDALRLYLGTGVTTIRDVGGPPEVLLPMRDRLASGELEGPRLFTYGPLLDGDPPIFPRTGGGPASALGAPEPIASIEQGVALVEELIEQGVDGLKLYAGLRPDILVPMLEAVGGRVPVAGHLGRTWASEAVAAGINTLEHVHATCYQDVARPEDRHGRDDGNGAMPNYWRWLNHGWANADLDAAYVREFIDSLVERGVGLSDTMVLITNGMATTEASEEPGLRYTPKSMRLAREERMKRMQEMREAGQAPPAPEPLPPGLGERSRATQLEFLRRVHEAGGRLLPGTDAGSHTGLVAGFSLHHELELLAEAGIPHADVLRLATLGAAESLGVADEQGTLRPGQRADLVVVDGDPLTTMRDTRNVHLVVQRGVAIEPQAVLDRIER